ncbi:MAG TPA: hypothetical protein VGG33_21945, partial [Polyangia bacterium]
MKVIKKSHGGGAEVRQNARQLTMADARVISSAAAAAGSFGSGGGNLGPAEFGPAPRVAPPLDSSFRPLYLALRVHAEAARAAGATVLGLALERRPGVVSTFSLPVFPDGHPQIAASQAIAERVLKFLLWQRGGHHVSVAGPTAIAAELARQYAPGGARAFDADFFAKIYEQPKFTVEHVTALPREAEEAKAVGGHLDGCRIGFDAGGSDRKVAAVIDGKEVFSCEIVWQPKLESDPNYHFDGIDDSIRKAAEHLPRIDAIGVSSAGIYVDNRTMVASLFRKVPEDAFNARI